MQSLASSVARCAFTSGVIFGATLCALPSFEVFEDGGAVASEELCDAGCAPVLCREWDSAGALSDFWVCVWKEPSLVWAQSRPTTAWIGKDYGRPSAKILGNARLAFSPGFSDACMRLFDLQNALNIAGMRRVAC